MFQVTKSYFYFQEFNIHSLQFTVYNLQFTIYNSQIYSGTKSNENHFINWSARPLFEGN